MPLRRSLLCLAALATLAACQRPRPAQQAAPPPAPAAQPAPHAASAPSEASAPGDAGGGEPTPAPHPRPSPSASPMPTQPPSSPPPDAARGAPQTLLLKDSGVRCITFPCPTYSVQAEGAAEPREVHELDLSQLGSDEERERVEQGLERGVRVEGTLSVRRKAGPAGDATVLRVTRLLK